MLYSSSLFLVAGEFLSQCARRTSGIECCVIPAAGERAGAGSNKSQRARCSGGDRALASGRSRACCCSAVGGENDARAAPAVDFSPRALVEWHLAFICTSQNTVAHVFLLFG